MKINWENILWYAWHFWFVWPTLAVLVVAPVGMDLPRLAMLGWYAVFGLVAVLLVPLIVGSREHEEWCQEIQRKRRNERP